MKSFNIVLVIEIKQLYLGNFNICRRNNLDTLLENMKSCFEQRVLTLIPKQQAI